ncbi:AN1-like Zinc finger, partial [Teladorsagia circumcincta]
RHYVPRISVVRALLTSHADNVFFDPPESVEELEITRNNLMLPPSNINELLEIKADRRKLAPLVCKFCHRKLALTEQHIRCLCEQRFCKKHRLPAAHLCGIDYKQTGRSRITKENPKVSEGGYHKAREE